MVILKFNRQNKKFIKKFYGKNFNSLIHNLIQDEEEKNNFFKKREYIRNKRFNEKNIFILNNKNYEYIFKKSRKKFFNL